MNHIHNKRGQFASKRKPVVRQNKVPWHIGLLILSSLVLMGVGMAHRAKAQNYEPLELPIKIEAPKRTTSLTPEEEAQVRAKQELILKEAEALKKKKLLEVELSDVESQLSQIRKQSLSFK